MCLICQSNSSAMAVMFDRVPKPLLDFIYKNSVDKVKNVFLHAGQSQISAGTV